MKRSQSGHFKQFCHNPLHEQWCLSASQSGNLTPLELETARHQLVRQRHLNSSQLERLHDIAVQKGVPVDSKFARKDRKYFLCEICTDTLARENFQEFLPNDNESFPSSRPSTPEPEVRLSVSPSASASTSTSYTGPTSTPGRLFRKDDILSADFVTSLSDEEAIRLAKLLANRQVTGKRREEKDRFSNYRSLNALSALDIDNYYEEFDPVLCTFLEEYCGLPRSDHAKFVRIKALEQIYYDYMSCSVVLPFSFLQNLLLWTRTTSKVAVNIFGCTGPHGCYDTVKDWLSQQANCPTPYPDQDIVVVFDNNQVIGRCWTVKVNNKVQANVVTTVCCLEYPEYNRLQWEPNLAPKNWPEVNSTDVADNVRGLSENVQETAQSLLHRSLKRHLSSVKNEQELVGDVFRDNVDVKAGALQSQVSTKVCAKCGTLNAETKRKCENPRCGCSLKQAQEEASGKDQLGTYTLREKVARKDGCSETRMRVKETSAGLKVIQDQDTGPVDPHSYLESEHGDHPPVLTVVDPVFVNPNSHDSLRLILRQVGIGAGIKLYGKGNREWVFLVCDGLPYGLAQSVIQSTYRCPVCRSSGEWFGTIEAFRKHVSSDHAGSDNDIEPIKEFDWVVLRPGNGHFEMNMVKSMVELNWDVIFLELSKLMGYRSENALRAAKRCSDHHKAWSFLDIAYNGCLDELLVPFVRKCLKEGEEDTPAGFLRFLEQDAEDPNYRYMGVMVCKYMQSVQNLRSGLRRLNEEAINCAKRMFAPLFHSRNHPKYQGLEITDAILRENVPADLHQFFKEAESVTLTADRSAGEGPDFKAEVVNKEVQSWMPRGVPSGEDWLQVSRCLSALQQLKKKALVHSRTSTDATISRRKRDLDDQTMAWRVELRRKEYRSQPLSSREHVSLSGELLDKDLVQFQTTAEMRRNEYFDAKFGGLDVKQFRTSMVYVTQKEKTAASDFNAMTKQRLLTHMEKELPSINDSEEREKFTVELLGLKGKVSRVMKGKVSRVKKDVIIEFANRVQDFIEHQIDEMAISEITEEES